MNLESRILLEDNHLIVVNKEPGELVQGDGTGDITLADKVREYLKEKYSKPGNVYLGIPHRLDRPTSGAVIYCRTEKALIRMNASFKSSSVSKFYWAITDRKPDREEGELVHWITRDSEQNMSTAYRRKIKGAKEAVLRYRSLASSENYSLLEIELLTGRHHQIRAQLKAEGIHIKGDLKYGAARSNPDGGICLHSRRIIFNHPVRDAVIDITAPCPGSSLWNYFEKIVTSSHSSE